MIFFVAFILSFAAYIFSFVSTVPQGEPIHDASSSLTEMVECGMLNFALNFMSKLIEQTEQKENILLSPLSIYGALASLHLGSESVTKDELSRVLGFQGSDNDLIAFHEKFQNKFQNILNAKDLNVAIAAGIFIQNGLQIEPTYLEQIQNDAGTIVENIDFHNSRTATDSVNKWISDQTRGHIPELFPEPLSTSTLILLATTLYFEAKWEQQLELDTEEEKFTTCTGEVTDATFLSDTRNLPYYKNDILQFEAVSLAYKNKQFRFYIVLPAQSSDVQALTRALTANELKKMIQECEKNEELVLLKMPKLKFDWNKTLSEVLRSLGLEQTFEEANLRKMVNQPIQVSEVIHATTIQVYELGTEATAATAIALLGSSGMQPPVNPIKFIVNRPFMFFIYNVEEETILFSGVVNKPM